MSDRISRLPDEVLLTILMFLRATDLASCREVNKLLSDRERISTIVEFQLLTIYHPFLLYVNSSQKVKTWPLKNDEYRCDVLFVKEMKSIAAAIAFTNPFLTKGYWVSSSWLSNAKKHFEAQVLPDLEAGSRKGHTRTKKSSRIRQRRGSDCLPPWPGINADLVCPHGGLALPKQPRARRKLVDKHVWCFLR